MSRTAAAARESGDKKTALRRALLAWYDSARRVLPWRAGPGERADPYRVWLSEIMLQQTTVAAVGPYFARFLDLFPDVQALASAPRESVLAAWAGLGYYSRARNLHAAAQILARDGFPTDEAGWRALPGIGPYTAAALAAIALDQEANVVDGNVERVMARLYAVEVSLPEAKPLLRAHAGALVTADRPGDWAQALMDLGATICTPTSPKCLLCPLSTFCAAFARGEAESFPRKTPKAAKPERAGVAYRLRRGRDLWLVRRVDKGMLGGMAGLPTTPWRDEAWSAEEARALAPSDGEWTRIGVVRHVFTHFALTLDIWEGEGSPRDQDGWWAETFDALPTLFRKAAKL